ncbi:MAG TPA: PQQ-binding-like beta-propeller repeat protein, partial [Gemmataceae bacterium]|nr:PQQ-binding-like beta-propeller repeat protein [Gemmataceae bacterium]
MSRILTALLGVVSISAVAAAEPAWPQFRGPGGAGVAPDDQKPPTQIGPDKNVKWKVSVPSGYSSPVIAADKLFLTAFDDGKLLTIAYSRTDGKELWRKEAPAKKIEAYHKTESSPAASTPATDGERLVVYFGSCGMICYDLNGNEQWRYELPTAETDGGFGTGSSPVIADGKVVLLRDQSKDSKLVALDLKDGSVAWEVKRDGFRTSWGSAFIWDTPEGKQVVVPGTTRLKAYDLKSGAEKWTVSGLPALPCTTPVIGDGKLIFAGWAPGGADFKFPSFDELLEQAGEKEQGYLTKAGSEKTMLKGFFDSNDVNKDGKITRDEWEALTKFVSSGKNRAIAISPGGTGDISKSHVAWSVEKGLPYIPSPLVYKGTMYTVNGVGRLTAG